MQSPEPGPSFLDWAESLFCLARCHALGGSPKWGSLGWIQALSCQILSLILASPAPTPPHQKTSTSGSCWDRQKTNKNLQGTYSSGCLAFSLRGQAGVLSGLGASPLRTTVSARSEEKSFGSKRSLLRPSHFLLRFPPLPLMHRLGKVAKEAGPG